MVLATIYEQEKEQRFVVRRTWSYEAYTSGTSEPAFGTGLSEVETTKFGPVISPRALRSTLDECLSLVTEKQPMFSP